MTFSIRDLLVVIFLVALGLLTWRTAREQSRAAATSMRLQAEIASLKAQLRLDQPGIHQAMLRALDEHQPLAKLRERSLEQFHTLRARYQVIEPRTGDVLSLRGVPSLAADGAAAPVLFRMQVPDERPIWLKYGVHDPQRFRQGPQASGDEKDLLRESPFSLTGPFEMQLAPGDPTLAIRIGAARDGALPVELSLDEVIVLQTTFTADGVKGAGFAYTSATTQLDFDSSHELPWLLTATINTVSGGGQAFSVWLSDRSSGFARFPARATPSENRP